MMDSRSAIEDYVKTIYAHTEWQPRHISSTALAARLGLVPSSVTEMVKKLAAAGLVEHVPYGTITLTEGGEALALRMLRRHRLIETWLVESFSYPWDEVHDEAEVLEHTLSDRLLDAIDAQLGHPTRDPHGDPIPAADGQVLKPDAVPIAVAPRGQPLRVVRISDRDPRLLRLLEQYGVGLDAVVTINGPSAGDGLTRLDADGAGLDLDLEAAESIWVCLH